MGFWLAKPVLACLMLAQSGAPITLRYGFFSGQTLTFHLTQTMDSATGPVSTNKDVTVYVDIVGKDGGATIDVSEKGDSPSPSFQALVSGLGRWIEPHLGKSIVVVPEMPIQPVAVGDKWQGPLDVGADLSPTSLQAKFNLQSIQESDGHRIAKIAIAAAGDLDPAPNRITMNGWMDWDISEGHPTHLHLDGTRMISHLGHSVVLDWQYTGAGIGLNLRR